MARDDLQKRIAEMNKRPLENVPTEDNAELGGLRRKLKKQAESKLAKLAKDKAIFPASEAPTPDSSRQDSGVQPSITYSRRTPSTGNRIEAEYDTAPVALEDAIDGVPAPAPSGGEYYHIEMSATCLDPAACDLHGCFTPLLGYPEGEAVERIAMACKAERLAPEELVFVDLETTGLSMTPVFLIGTMECTCDAFVFKQYLARDYSEEAAILSVFSERLREAKMIVTFNGKSFDVPFLQSRAIATGIKLPRPKSHLDLLHESRRHYGRTMPNHKLQTLERIVCGRCREDDIPGALIPAAYHDYVRTGNARKIGSILTHNLHDLLTMADLMHKMWQR